MNPMWKIYKSKVLKTLNPEYDDDAAEEVTGNDMIPVQDDDGPSAVSQMARKMQGAGAKSWNRLSSLFNKEDEHQLLEETETPPIADHPLALKPEEHPRTSKRTAFWDSFSTNWAAKKQADAAAAATSAAATNEAVEDQADEGETEENLEEQEEESKTGGRSNSSFSKYVSLGGGGEDASFKWNFMTGKLAELKTKSMAKTNDLLVVKK